MTMTNAEWCIKNGIKFKEIEWKSCSDSDYDLIGYYDKNGHFNECYKGKFYSDSISETILTWLDMEHKEPILDDVEKSYLSAVIKPFRDRVKYIAKAYDNVGIGAYYIFIKFADASHCMDFPLFGERDMYKGMKPGHAYSLEELVL